MERFYSAAVVAGLCLALCCTFHSPASEDDPKVLGRAAIQGYRQHMDKFDRMKLEYRHYWAAKPPSTFQEAAKLGSGLPENKGITCIYVLDGKNWSYKVDADDPPFDSKKLVPDKANPGLAWGPSPKTCRVVGNGTESLKFTPGFEQAGLSEADTVSERDGPASFVPTPLHRLGFRNPELNPYDLMIAAERDGASWSAKPPVMIDIIPCVPVSFTLPNKVGRGVFYLDLRRGYVPIRIQVFGKDSEGKEVEFDRTDVLELRACSDDRWLPVKVRKIRFPAVQGEFQSSVAEITKWDVDNRPATEDLTIDLPAGTRITRQMNMQKPSVKLRQGERIGPDDLTRLVEMSEARIENPLIDTAVQPAGRPWWHYGLPVAGVLAIGAVVGIRLRGKWRA